MMQRLFIMFSLILLIVFSGCVGSDKNADDENLSVKYVTDERTNDEQTNYNTSFFMTQPELEGGSEMIVREPHPVSNDLLQRKYPETVFLHGSRDRDEVALTFDDGPDIRFTPLVLDVLDRHNVKATFFLMGNRAKEHDQIVERIHDSGHAIGNHTYWHPNLPEEQLDRLDWEVRETANVLEQITGERPYFFRSPYGALNEEMVEKLRAMDQKVIGWDVDSLDWKQLTPDIIADNVLSNVSPGSIILMHDAGDWTMNLMGTVEALDQIITKLKEDDISFVTVPELLNFSELQNNQSD